jgi:TPR repeat protein
MKALIGTAMLLFTAAFAFGSGLDLDSLLVAAKAGDALAQCQLGNWYQYGEEDEAYPDFYPNNNSGIYWWRKSAQQGNAEALYNLATHINYLDSVVDEVTVAQYYGIAARQGFLPAWIGLGERYNEGLGVVHNPIRALECYTNAAEMGYPDAMIKLGICYLNGDGVPQDADQAYFWLYAGSRLRESRPLYSPWDGGWMIKPITNNDIAWISLPELEAVLGIDAVARERERAGQWIRDHGFGVEGQ